MEGFSPFKIKNNSFCGGCDKWFDEDVPRRKDLVRIGDEEKGFADFHPECIEKALQKGILYRLE